MLSLVSRITGRQLILITLVVLVLSCTLTASTASGGYPRLHVLVVATDFADAVFAGCLAGGLGVPEKARVDLLYISKDNPDAPSLRSSLSRLDVLLGYDAVVVPDFNTAYAYGGRLTVEEARALIEYVRRGGVLVVGMNTLIQSWSPIIANNLGVMLAGIVSAQTDTEALDINWSGAWISYNDTYGALEAIALEGTQVVARFARGAPAVTVSRCGHGYLVALLYNPVRLAVEQGDKRGCILLARLIARLSLEREKNTLQPLPGVAVRLEPTAGLLQLAPALPLAAYAVLVVLALAGRLGLHHCVPVMKPVAKPFSMLIARLTSIRSLVETVHERGWVDLSTAKGSSRVAACLAAAIGAIHYTVAGKRVVAYVPGSPLVLQALASNQYYQKLVTLVAQEPGITLTQLAEKLGLDLDKVVRIVRELRKSMLVEVIRLEGDCEVYPTPLLRRLVEAQPERHDRGVGG